MLCAKKVSDGQLKRCAAISGASFFRWRRHQYFRHVIELIKNADHDIIADMNLVDTVVVKIVLDNVMRAKLRTGVIPGFDMNI